MKLLFEFLKNNADVASAIAALAGVFIALCALLVSWYANRTAKKTLEIQHNHNVLSVKPIPEITVADYEDSLRVRLRNNGMGTMVIISAEFTNQSHSKGSLMAMMPALPNSRAWNHFTTDIAERTLQPGKLLPLLELSAREGESNFGASRDLVREYLKDIEVTVYYTDVYKTKFSAYKKELTWFGRNIP